MPPAKEGRGAVKGHHPVRIDSLAQAQALLREIGADDFGVKWMAPKAVFRAVKLKDIPCRAANIIKQEMLSKGGEAAVRRDAVSGQGSTDVLLLGTLRQYRELVGKLALQPFGLKALAEELSRLLEGLEPAGSRTMRLPGGRQLEVGGRTLVMGVLNVTPDSFSDGGRYLQLDAARARAAAMVEEGADLVDVGGMSTRPGHQVVPVEEELRRVLPVVERLAAELPVPVSVDTNKGEVAAACLQAGAHLINDVSGTDPDPTLLQATAAAGAGLIIMHSRRVVDAEQLVDRVVGDLAEAVARAEAAGVDGARLMVDPGIGFGKTAEQNLEVVRRLYDLQGLGRPVVLGTSRKSFIGHVLDLPVEERLEGSLATVAAGIMQGVQVVRVHDVRATRRLADMLDRLRGGG